MMRCAVCDGVSGKEYAVREMMFGTREPFTYWECVPCGCLQLSPVPSDLSPYYPKDYYSFRTPPVARWKRWFYYAHLVAPQLMKRLRPCQEDFAAVAAAKPRRGARILDVGSGSGRLVELLQDFGFEAQGIDPFLETDTPYVKRASLDTVEGQWDLIMFHHSLEHMADQREVLEKARARLTPGGVCLVRVPIANWAWQHYGRDWFQLDPPRHLVVHSPASLQRTATDAGFAVSKIIYDSSFAQFAASELYRRDIPLRDQNIEQTFSAEEMRSFRERARALNEAGLGDQAAFLLTPL